MTDVSVVDAQDFSASTKTYKLNHERMDIDNSMPGEAVDEKCVWGNRPPQVLRELTKAVAPNTQWNWISDFPKTSTSQPTNHKVHVYLCQIYLHVPYTTIQAINAKVWYITLKFAHRLNITFANFQYYNFKMAMHWLGRSWGWARVLKPTAR